MFPPELIAHIVANTPEEALPACCLVSSAFLEPAQKRMHRKIRFIAATERRHGVHWPCISDVAEHYGKHPHLAKYLKKLHIDFQFEEDEETAALVVLLQLFTNVRRVSMMFVDWRTGSVLYWDTISTARPLAVIEWMETRRGSIDKLKFMDIYELPIAVLSRLFGLVPKLDFRAAHDETWTGEDPDMVDVEPIVRTLSLIDSEDLMSSLALPKYASLTRGIREFIVTSPCGPGDVSMPFLSSISAHVEALELDGCEGMSSARLCGPSVSFPKLTPTPLGHHHKPSDFPSAFPRLHHLRLRQLCDDSVCGPVNLSAELRADAIHAILAEFLAPSATPALQTVTLEVEFLVYSPPPGYDAATGTPRISSLLMERLDTLVAAHPRLAIFVWEIGITFDLEEGYGDAQAWFRGWERALRNSLPRANAKGKVVAVVQGKTRLECRSGSCRGCTRGLRVP